MNGATGYGPVTLSPQALANLLSQAANQAHAEPQAQPHPSASQDTYERAPAPPAALHPPVAMALSIVGIAAAGACLAHLHPTRDVQAQRAKAQRFALAAPAVWAGAHLLLPRMGGTIDVVAATGVGFVVFSTVVLALRNSEMADPITGARKISGRTILIAAVAGAALGLVWHDAVLPNAALHT